MNQSINWNFLLFKINIKWLILLIWLTEQTEYMKIYENHVCMWPNKAIEIWRNGKPTFVVNVVVQFTLHIAFNGIFEKEWTFRIDSSKSLALTPWTCLNLSETIRKENQFKRNTVLIVRSNVQQCYNHHIHEHTSTVFRWKKVQSIMGHTTQWLCEDEISDCIKEIVNCGKICAATQCLQ